MHKTTVKQLKIVFALLLSLLILACSNKSTDNMEALFKNPPPSSKPRTWMHAMSRNMSKEGITKDLESMAEVGIGGLLLFNITQGIPLGKVIYNSPEHHAILQHAASEAERLGLSFGVHNCDGWSSSGGPWIKPENAIKMVVWSEQVIKGGTHINTQLKQPTKREGFYKDIAVIAYPSLMSEIHEQLQSPTISSSNSNRDISELTDGSRDKPTLIQGINNDKPWVQFSYKNPFTARAAFVLHTERFGTGSIYTSNDGKNFSHAFSMKTVRTGKGEWAMNDHFDPLTAKHFRFVFDNKTPSINIKEIELRATYMYNNPLGRTALARAELQDLNPIGNPEKGMIIEHEDIKNLSDKLNDNGILSCNLPEGYWTILRFGYTTTGAFNNPASNEGRGLESDKLSKKATKIHFDSFSKKVIENGKKIAPNAMQYVEIDSYEMGGQNWTDHLDSIFIARKGYELINFLPLYAGRFINNAETTESVLWDLRDVICDLMTENYFEYFTDLCHQHGINSYIEPYGFGPVNELEVGGKTDIPMGEFWMNRDMPMVPPAVSSAHIYGKNKISAESFTSTPEINWKGHPAMAKSSGDKAWARGINEFMFHRFAHQANPYVEPGMTMNRWGFHFDRTQTWWKNAGAAWFKYIARGSYMLRQGIPVSDILVFVGESAPNGSFTPENLIDELPVGFNFDNVNADVLLNRIDIKNKELFLPEGTQYKALILKNNSYMSLKLLKRLNTFAKRGLIIIGNPPDYLAGYGHSTKDEISFKKLIKETWEYNNCYANTSCKDVFQELNIQPDLIINEHENLEFAHRKTALSDIYFLYNPDTTAVLYTCTFRLTGLVPEIWDPKTGFTRKIAQFKQTKGATVAQIPLEREGSAFIVFREKSNNMTVVNSLQSSSDKQFTESRLNKTNNIEFTAERNDSYHITLSNGSSRTVEVNSLPSPTLLKGAWALSFANDDGSEYNTVFNYLIDWKNHSDDFIRHYAGTAKYKKQFEITRDLDDCSTIILDLGELSIVARVKVNNKDLGVLWKKPFVIDITDAAIKGNNTLELEVTNQWSNRLIGDERYPANDGGYKLQGHNPTASMPEWYTNNQPRPKGKRKTFTTAAFYKASDSLISSGLIGPVQIRYNKLITINIK